MTIQWSVHRLDFLNNAKLTIPQYDAYFIINILLQSSINAKHRNYDTNKINLKQLSQTQIKVGITKNTL